MTEIELLIEILVKFLDLIPMPTPNPSSNISDIAKIKDKVSQSQPQPPVSPLKCFTGSFLAGTLGLLLYRLTTAIAQVFASHPAPMSKQLAYNISVAVRTLVVGMAAMGTGIFTLAAVGLFALGLKLLFASLFAKQPAD